jgi:phosphoenolpyruvate---glycerone phosphotransferase subunit DhaL
VNTETVRRWMELSAQSIHEQRDYLTQLDAAIGDADHGTNMDRGFTALEVSLDRLIAENPLPGDFLISVGDTLLAAIGGASGALWGTAFRSGGKALGDVREFECEDLASVIEGALEGVMELGAANEGDKTMVDALAPALRALRRNVADGATAAESLAATRQAGEEGMRATVELEAQKGRASYLGERSIGHQDPGATSTVLILAALESAVAESA